MPCVHPPCIFRINNVSRVVKTCRCVACDNSAGYPWYLARRESPESHIIDTGNGQLGKSRYDVVA